MRNSITVATLFQLKRSYLIVNVETGLEDSYLVKTIKSILFS